MPLTVVFTTPMPCMRMELAVCLTLRCLLLDIYPTLYTLPSILRYSIINAPTPNTHMQLTHATDPGVHDADAINAYGVGDVSDVEVFVAGY